MLTYRLGSAFFGAQTGIVAAALFATYPRVVIGEKSLSNVNTVPFFTLIFFLCLFALVVSQRSVAIIPALATLAILDQLHLSSLSLVVVLCLALALFWPRLRVAHLAVGVASALFITSPYLIAQGLGGWENIRSLFSHSTRELAPRNLWELCRVADDILRVFPDLVMGSLRGIEHTWLSGAALWLTRLETWLIMIGTAYVCGAALVPAVRHDELRASRAAYSLLALWLVVPILTLGQKDFIVAHHFELLTPRRSSPRRRWCLPFWESSLTRLGRGGRRPFA